MKQIKKKSNLKLLLILLIISIAGLALLTVIQNRQDTRSSAAGVAACSSKDLTGKLLYGTCNAYNQTGSCSTSTGYNGMAVKGLCKNTSYYCCLPDTGKLPGAEGCVNAGGVCTRVGNYTTVKDGSTCSFDGSRGTVIGSNSKLCLGTYGANDIKCCKLAKATPTPKPSCIAKGGVCVGNVRTCTIGKGGSVINGTTCSGKTPVCCRLTK
ncbi:MAG: hypothetical protein PHO75_00555 [Candidatus Shapirobacteria bacterium]|nr:hypothetical protein [Candidatus Shapirobacteria bacterium]